MSIYIYNYNYIVEFSSTWIIITSKRRFYLKWTTTDGPWFPLPSIKRGHGTWPFVTILPAATKNSWSNSIIFHVLMTPDDNLGGNLGQVVVLSNSNLVWIFWNDHRIQIPPISWFSGMTKANKSHRECLDTRTFLDTRTLAITRTVTW